MHIQQTFSHLNGEEFLLIRQPAIYEEVRNAVEAIQLDPGNEKTPNQPVRKIHQAIVQRLDASGWIRSSDPSYFFKKRIAVAIPHPQSDALYVKHLAFYIGDQIDVGIEILPMKSLQAQMSSGVSYYEGELYNVVRQGRGVPAVPLVLVGIDA
jgi:hypothetical protein